MKIMSGLSLSEAANFVENRPVIDTDEKLSGFLPSLRQAAWVCLDTEADSLYAYPDKLCLLQFSVPGMDVLIDPLAKVDLAPLWHMLKNRELILHGADYDLRLLFRNQKFTPARIFDTMLAARLLGYPRFSLSDLVDKHLGATLEKGPQKANWAQRPLTPRMETYARNDTRHLKAIEEILREKLHDKGRLGWHAEACARLIQETANSDGAERTDAWRLKGSHRLGPRALGILREAWDWREREAIAANKPPFFVLAHELLVDLAEIAAHGKDWEGCLPPHLSSRRRSGLQKAVRTGLSIPEAQQPQPLMRTSSRLTEAQKKKLAELEARRNRKASELKLDPSIIASRAMLLALVRNDAELLKHLMRWQKELLA